MRAAAAVIGIAGIGLAVLAGWTIYDKAARHGVLGKERPAGEPAAEAVAPSVIFARQQADESVAPQRAAKQILFGDLHVHSTYSTDAFLWALPLNQGKGVHPIADACDYARYCSAIDFWAITDHAEALTPWRWDQTKETIRQCQAKSPDTANPDLVAMIGFEWTQVGALPSEHYGHKNVIFKDLADADVAARPIAAAGAASDALRDNTVALPGIVALADFQNAQDYWDINLFFRNVQAAPSCDASVSSDALPNDCFEVAATPGELVARLDQQGLDPLIIPHGSSWGFYTPPGTSWDKQLTPAQRPDAFRLIEIYSGHGNSEEYRDYSAVTFTGKFNDGVPVVTCPPKTDIYTPPCVRAGEIIEERCLADGDSVEVCWDRARKARETAANMGIAYHLAVSGETPGDWLESGQCLDCYMPAFQHRPQTSVQYGLAISHFDEANPDAPPQRFNWGFIASSDNHRARPGTGYKEVARRLNTEAGGPKSPRWRRLFLEDEGPADAQIHPRNAQELQALAGFQLTELERQSSFWQTGGLAAVHADGRSREAIWAALQRRETYATSGPRMLLWFDHMDEDGARSAMGASVDAQTSGRFSVRAVGSFKQKPGCPDHAAAALGADRIADICSGECYHPTDERNLIERIEVIRIRPQISKDEAIGDLIDDPFLVHQCTPDQHGCDFEFEDPDFANGGRDALYYVRAIQEPRETINADPVRCERDAEGNCVKANLCFGDWRSGDEDCTAPMDVRAWSSPIYLSYQNSLINAGETEAR